MKNIVLVVFFFTFLNMGCTNQNTNSQEEEHQALQNQYEGILQIANSISCIDSDDWTFTAIGAKACGGPIGYIAYPLSIDTESFLNKVAEYTEAQNSFNIKWGIISDCSMPPVPSAVICVDDVAKLIY